MKFKNSHAWFDEPGEERLVIHGGPIQSPPHPPSAPPSLELRDLEGGGAGEVQEEGSFLFGQEGGGDDVVEAGWDVVRLHVAEATPAGGEATIRQVTMAMKTLFTYRIMTC